VARAALIAALALAGCGSAPAPRADLARGRELFRSQRCGSCHALRDARTTGGSGPDLDTSEPLDRAQIRHALSEGANGMPDYSQALGGRDLDALTAYLYDVTHPGNRLRPR
jgi:mono/diheme cytochrome c family protein